MRTTKLTAALMTWGSILVIATGVNHWIAFSDIKSGILIKSFSPLMILLGIIIIGTGASNWNSSDKEDPDDIPSSLDIFLIFILSIYTIIFTYFGVQS